MLSNLFACYHESNLIFSGKELIKVQQKYPSIESIHPKFVDQFLNSVYNLTGRYLCCNNDFRSLPSNERSMMLNGAANNISCLTGVFFMNYCRLYDLEQYHRIMKNRYG